MAGVPWSNRAQQTLFWKCVHNVESTTLKVCSQCRKYYIHSDESHEDRSIPNIWQTSLCEKNQTDNQF